MNTPLSSSAPQPSEREVTGFFKDILLGKNKAVAAFLDTYPAALEKKDKYGTTPLAMAAQAAAADMAALLLGRGACVDAEANTGTTPLMWAAEQGCDDIIKLLLGKGAYADNKDDSGETALMWAARNEHKSTIELLLENGASLNAKNRYGETALDIAREGYDLTSTDEAAAMAEAGVVALLEQWPERKRAQFLQDTDCSRGLKKAIPKPRLFKIPRPKP